MGSKTIATPSPPCLGCPTWGVGQPAVSSMLSPTLYTSLPNYLVSWSATATTLYLFSSLITRSICLSSPSVVMPCRTVSTGPSHSTTEHSIILGAKLGYVFALLYVDFYIVVKPRRAAGSPWWSGVATSVIALYSRSYYSLLTISRGALGMVPSSALWPFGNHVPRPFVGALPAPNQASGLPGKPVWCGCPSH